VAASADVSSALKTETLRCGRSAGTGLVIRNRLVLRPWGGSRELKSRGCTLLLSQFGSLLRLGKGKGVAALVTSTRGSTTTTTVVGVLILLVIILTLLVVIGVSGSTRRRSRGRTHRKARESRLIATVGVLVRCVHGHPKLLLLLGKLEGVDLRRDTTHGAAWRESVDLAQLLGLQETHVHVLLVCRGNLLLLLLKQLNLLLNSQLFHHQRGQLRWTSPVSDVELAPTRALCPRLALLIHDPGWRKTASKSVKCGTDGEGDPETGETGEALER
jgi:hypothetical protein